MWAKQVLAQIIRQVSYGVPFSQALKNQPDIFSRFVVGLVFVGEETGSLGTNLDKLAAYLEEHARVRLTMRASLIYPALLFSVAIGGTILLIKIFVPAFLPALSDMGQTLPLPTRFLLFLSGLFSMLGFWFILLGLTGVIAVLLFARIRRAGNRNEFLLKLPFVGNILKKGILAQVTSTLATAHAAGLSLSKGLELVVATVDNDFFRSFIQDSRLALASGEKLSTYFLKNRCYVPSFMGHMMAVIESTGETEAVMLKCSRLFEEEMEYLYQRFIQLLEPFILILIGLAVGFIMLGIFLPLYQMFQVVS